MNHSNDQQLTLRQQRFVDEYSISLNGAAAATAAGFSPRSAKVTASRMLTRANVRLALGARQAEIAADLRVSRDGVLRQLLDAIAIARRNNDPRAMIDGWVEIARLCGFYPAQPRA